MGSILRRVQDLLTHRQAQGRRPIDGLRIPGPPPLIGQFLHENLEKYGRFWTAFLYFSACYCDLTLFSILSESKNHTLTFWYHIGTILIMPRKIRQLIKELEKAGFVNRSGKGKHRNFIHPKGMAMTVSGNLGDDAKHYQEKEVELKIERSKR